MTQEDNLYKLLEVSPSASVREIKESYRKLTMKHHPDRGGDSVYFNKITDAYNILSNPDKRNRYDIMINLVKIGEEQIEIVQDSESKIQFNIKQGLGTISIQQVK